MRNIIYLCCCMKLHWSDNKGIFLRYKSTKTEKIKREIIRSHRPEAMGEISTILGSRDFRGGNWISQLICSVKSPRDTNKIGVWFRNEYWRMAEYLCVNWTSSDVPTLIPSSKARNYRFHLWKLKWIRSWLRRLRWLRRPNYAGEQWLDVLKFCF